MCKGPIFPYFRSTRNSLSRIRNKLRFETNFMSETFSSLLKQDSSDADKLANCVLSI